MKQYIPTNVSQVAPYLIILDIREELRFLQAVFEAKVLDISEMPDGSIMHAAVKIGNCDIMMGQGSEAYPPIPAMIHIYVPECDATFQRALQEGATEIRKPADQFYGDRSGGVESKNGIKYWIATFIRHVSKEEMEQHFKQSSI